MSIKLISDEHLNAHQVILKLLMLYLNSVLFSVGCFAYQNNHRRLLAVSVLRFPFEPSVLFHFVFLLQSRCSFSLGNGEDIATNLSLFLSLFPTLFLLSKSIIQVLCSSQQRGPLEAKQS